jgi:hypothetical protein
MSAYSFSYLFTIGEHMYHGNEYCRLDQNTAHEIFKGKHECVPVRACTGACACSGLLILSLSGARYHAHYFTPPPPDMEAMDTTGEVMKGQLQYMLAMCYSEGGQ